MKLSEVDRDILNWISRVRWVVFLLLTITAMINRNWDTELCIAVLKYQFSALFVPTILFALRNNWKEFINSIRFFVAMILLIGYSIAFYLSDKWKYLSINGALVAAILFILLAWMTFHISEEDVTWQPL